MLGSGSSSALVESDLLPISPLGEGLAILSAGLRTAVFDLVVGEMSALGWRT